MLKLNELNRLNQFDVEVSVAITQAKLGRLLSELFEQRSFLKAFDCELHGNGREEQAHQSGQQPEGQWVQPASAMG
jgi:hypothetical protein